MTPASFDYSEVVPYIDLAAAVAHNTRDTTRKDMSFPKPNVSRKYPQLSIPSHSLNRVSKLPSPQRRSCRKMASASDDSSNAVLMDQVLQQQQQQQYQYWNTQFSPSKYHHRQQGQAAPSTSCRPSSWHCPTLEPYQYMTPVSTTPYPCNNSNLIPNNSSNSSSSNNHNNSYSISYSASVSPEISSSPLLSPTYATTTDSLFSRDFGSPLQLYSNSAMFESNYHLTDKPWTLDSLPQNNYFFHSPFTRDERDYFQWNMNTSSNYLLENGSLTSPPTPNDTMQGHLSDQPYLTEKCVSSHSLAKNQSEEVELIGMGLYDGPESQKSPMFHHSSLDHLTEVQGTTFVQRRGAEPQGKGLKLEETFTPTLSDDDSSGTDDDDDYENGGND